VNNNNIDVGVIGVGNQVQFIVIPWTFWMRKMFIQRMSDQGDADAKKNGQHISISDDR